MSCGLGAGGDPRLASRSVHNKDGNMNGDEESLKHAKGNRKEDMPRSR
jgi:hypothetical protein